MRLRYEADRVRAHPLSAVRGRRMRSVASAVGGAALLFASSLAVGPSVAYAREDDDLEPRPVRAVVLVDESGSLTDGDITAEREATLAIVQSEFAPDSEMSVVGFGSDNGQRGQSAVNVVCQKVKVADGPSRDQFPDCVGKLHRRTAQEGDDTDFAAAVAQGLSLLGTEPDAGVEGPAKLMFLLTDGTLDVGDSPRYGPPPAQRRNDAAQSMLDGSLRKAATAGIQIWPLGFGDRIDKENLAAFAAKGSQRTCGGAASKPEARVVGGAADVTRSLVMAFAGARCATAPEPATGELGAGGSVELKVRVPEITSDGSIAVIKRSPRVTVRYMDPSGAVVPKSATVGDTSYQVSGESGPVEVLRIRNPQPGEWTIRLESPPDLPLQHVAATAIWQGVVRAAIALDPPMPEAGKEAVVSLRLQTRRGAITDPEVLRPLRVSVDVTGDGFSPFAVRLADDGKGADGSAGDGQYAGAVAVPSTATGALTFVGSVAGPGVGEDRRPLQTRVSQGPPPVRLQVRLEQDEVAPGETLSGKLTASNESADSVTLRLVLTDPTPGTLPGGVTPETVTVRPSGSVSVDIAIAMHADSHEGPGQLRLQLVDGARPDLVYKNELIGFDIRRPPLLPKWLLVGIVAAAAVLLLGLAGYAVRLVRRHYGAHVKGLTLELHGTGGGRPPFLAAPEHPPSREFRFRIDGIEGDVPVLKAARATDPDAYVARRDGKGGIVVTLPHGGEALRVTANSPQPIAGTHLRLGMRDRGGAADRTAVRVPEMRPAPESRREYDFDNDLT